MASSPASWLLFDTKPTKRSLRGWLSGRLNYLVVVHSHSSRVMNVYQFGGVDAKEANGGDKFQGCT